MSATNWISFTSLSALAAAVYGFWAAAWTGPAALAFGLLLFGACVYLDAGPRGLPSRLARVLLPWTLALGLFFFHGFSVNHLLVLALTNVLLLLARRGRTDAAKPVPLGLGSFLEHAYRYALLVLVLLVASEPLHDLATILGTAFQLVVFVLGLLWLVEAAARAWGWTGFAAGALAVAALVWFQFFASDRLASDTPGLLAGSGEARIEAAVDDEGAGEPDWKSLLPGPSQAAGGPLVLGPILGDPGSDHILVWGLADADRDLLVKLWKVGPGWSAWADSSAVTASERGALMSQAPTAIAPLALRKTDLGTGSAKLTGLEPDTTYLYDVQDASGRSAVPENVRLWCRFTTLPDRAASPLRFVFASCHKPRAAGSDYYSGEVIPQRFVMWEILSRQIRAERVDINLQIGDQIYADLVFDSSLPEPADWEKILREPAFREASEKRVQEAYRAIYVRDWAHVSMRRVHASVPMVTIWDDHEVRDGWGNVASDRQGTPESWVGGQGTRVDRLFQAVLSPGYDPEVPQRRWTSFFAGSTGFFLPDLRTYRDTQPGGSPGSWMGQDQKKAFEQWLSGPAGQAKTVILPLEQPLADAPGWAVEWLARDRSGEGSDGLGDDFRDKPHWSGTRAEVLGFLDRVFDWESRTGGRAFTLGGDSHIALLGRLTDERRPAGDPGRTLHEFTSSGISNKDGTSRFAYRLFSQLYGKTWYGPGLLGELALGSGPYRAEVLRINTRLNYGVVEVLPQQPSGARDRVRFQVLSEEGEGRADRVRVETFYDSAGIRGDGLELRFFKNE